MVDIAQVLHARVAGRHAQHLVIAAGLVGHAEHSDGAAPDEDAGKRGLLGQDKRVEGVAVESEGVFDEAVVVRVPRRREEHAIEPDAAGRVIHLVLIAAPRGNLDGDVKVQGGHAR